MKRKTIIALLALTLVLGGCGSKAQEPVQPSVSEIKEDVSIQVSEVEEEQKPIVAKVEPTVKTETEVKTEEQSSDLDKLGVSASSDTEDLTATDTEDKKADADTADTEVKKVDTEDKKVETTDTEDKKAETSPSPAKETFDVITKLRFDTVEEALDFLKTHEVDPKSYEIYGDDIKKMSDAIQKGGVYPWTFYGSNDYNFNLYEDMWVIDNSEAKYFKDADEVWRGAGVFIDGTVYYVECAYYDGELADEIYYFK